MTLTYKFALKYRLLTSLDPILMRVEYGIFDSKLLKIDILKMKYADFVHKQRSKCVFRLKTILEYR